MTGLGSPSKLHGWFSWFGWHANKNPQIAVDNQWMQGVPLCVRHTHSPPAHPHAARECRLNNLCLGCCFFRTSNPVHSEEMPKLNSNPGSSPGLKFGFGFSSASLDFLVWIKQQSRDSKKLLNSGSVRKGVGTESGCKWACLPSTACPRQYLDWHWHDIWTSSESDINTKLAQTGTR